MLRFRGNMQLHVICGSRDILLPGNRALAARLGARARLTEVSDRGHGFLNAASDDPVADAILTDIGQSITTHAQTRGHFAV